MEPIGTKIRRQRRRLGLTLDELAGRTAISKPYLSLIETGRVTNPPSDGKLRRLEQTLGFAPSELIGQAHLQRTPGDVRAVLEKLLSKNGSATSTLDATDAAATTGSLQAKSRGAGASGTTAATDRDNTGDRVGDSAADARTSTVLRELLGNSSASAQVLAGGAVPVVNRVSAGYPSDFTDLAYPPRVASEFVACPGLADKQAFAARVTGDSMLPKYREGDIIIFSPAAAAHDGDDCFVCFDDGQTTFKRVFFETDDAGRSVLRLQPRNERHRAQLTPAQRATGLYKAVYQFSRIDPD
jgi:phage repressor protein C with HTH and peptisase S24 domain